MSNQIAYQKLVYDLGELGYHNFFGVNRELKYLSKTLDPKETVLAAVRGYTKGLHTVLCVLTIRRIIFVNVQLVYGVQTSDVPLRMVNGISHDSGLILCNLVVTNGADNILVNDVVISQANRFIKDVNKALTDLDFHQNQRPVDGASELLEYKKLLDDHVITQAEFDRKKSQILGE